MHMRVEAEDLSTGEARAAFRRRDAGAVRAMFREYGRLVYAVAHRVLGRDDLAEDATQQTFVRAWQAADHLDVDRDAGPWLVTIARHAAIDIVRREARRPTSALDDVDARHRAVVTAPPDLETLDVLWRVRRAIDDLPPEQAEIVRLQHLRGMTQTKIAEELGIALGTVKSRSHRAHRVLAARLSQLR
jgi:RNA polymerase sigma-70 factor (ECF subfamily)